MTKQSFFSKGKKSDFGRPKNEKALFRRIFLHHFDGGGGGGGSYWSSLGLSQNSPHNIITHIYIYMLFL